MTTFLITAAIITLYVILFVVSGNCLKQYLITDTNHKFHQTFHIGLSFFIGLTTFLCSWVLAGHILNNAKSGLALATSLLISVSALLYLKNNRFRYNRYTVTACSLLTLLLVGLSIFKALSPMPEYFITQPEQVNPFAGFGSVAHSFRAGNITEYIVSTNSLPTIGQHSGQSIIASIPLFFDQNAPQLSLTIWLGIFISFLIIATYGLARLFIDRKYLALIPVLIVALGNSVLSPFYSSLTDTESALLLNSNIDSLIGIVTFLILSVLVYLSLCKNPTKVLLFTVFLTGLIWNITSGQMIVLFVLLMIWWSITARQNPQLINLIKTFLVFICGAALGAFFLGGIFSFSNSSNHTSIPGVMSLKQPDTPPISLRFPRTGESGSQTLSRLKEMMTPSQTEAEVKLYAPVENQTTEITSPIKQNKLLFAIAKVVRSIQVVFFPLLGLVIMYVIIKRKLYFSETKLTLIKQFWSSSLLLFGTGWIASTFFIVYGYYWELSKFFYIGVYLGMLCLGISLAMFIQNYKKYRPWLIALTAFILLGPTLELFGVRILGNIYLPPTEHPNFQSNIEGVSLKPLDLEERFNFLINNKGTYGENHE